MVQVVLMDSCLCLADGLHDTTHHTVHAHDGILLVECTRCLHASLHLGFVFIIHGDIEIHLQRLYLLEEGGAQHLEVYAGAYQAYVVAGHPVARSVLSLESDGELAIDDYRLCGVVIELLHRSLRLIGKDPRACLLGGGVRLLGVMCRDGERILTYGQASHRLLQAEAAGCRAGVPLVEIPAAVSLLEVSVVLTAQVLDAPSRGAALEAGVHYIAGGIEGLVQISIVGLIVADSVFGLLGGLAHHRHTLGHAFEAAALIEQAPLTDGLFQSCFVLIVHRAFQISLQCLYLLKEACTYVLGVGTGELKAHIVAGHPVARGAIATIAYGKRTAKGHQCDAVIRRLPHRLGVVVGKDPRTRLLSIGSRLPDIHRRDGERILTHGEVRDGLLQIEAAHLVGRA